MREKMFPRWGAALFALLPLSEILYCPVDQQTGYAAILASLITALICSGVALLPPTVRKLNFMSWLLAICALWPLIQSLSRMTAFVRQTAFPERSLWGLAFALTLSAILIARIGLIRCAMWSLPVFVTAGLLIALSGALTISDLHISYLQAPMWSLGVQCGRFLRAILPCALVISLSLPEQMPGAAARGMAIGGALLSLISLRTALLLGSHTAALLAYPNFVAAGLASVGDFARHGEVFFALPLLLCDLGRAAALGCVVLQPVRKIASKKAVKRHA